MFYDENLLINPYKIPNIKKLNKYENNFLFINEYNKKLEDGMRRARLKNLEPGMSDRLMLQSLIFNGQVCLFKDEEFGGVPMALQSTVSGKGINVNGDPVSAWVFSKNGVINKEIDLFIKGADKNGILNEGTIGYGDSRNPKGVLIYDNKRRYPFINYIIYYAKVISDTYRTVDINRMWLKHPFMPVCKEEAVNSVKEVLKKIIDNEEIIPISTEYDISESFLLNPIEGRSEAITSAVELIDWYEQKWRECCGFDSNSAIDKKGENLLDDEVHFNDDFTGKHQNSYIEYLQEQFDFANEVLGTNIQVEEVEGANDEEDGLQPDDSGRDTKSKPGDSGDTK